MKVSKNGLVNTGKRRGVMMVRADIKWESQLRKGLLDYFVLLVLAKKAGHGYAIAASLRKIDAFDVGEGTLYPLLARLAKRDLIKATWVTEGTGPAKKVYTITRKGRREISAMDESWHRFDAIRQSLGGTNARSARKRTR